MNDKEIMSDVLKDLAKSIIKPPILLTNEDTSLVIILDELGKVTVMRNNCLSP